MHHDSETVVIPDGIVGQTLFFLLSTASISMHASFHPKSHYMHALDTNPAGLHEHKQMLQLPSALISTRRPNEYTMSLTDQMLRAMSSPMIGQWHQPCVLTDLVACAGLCRDHVLVGSGHYLLRHCVLDVLVPKGCRSAASHTILPCPAHPAMPYPCFCTASPAP